MKKAKKKQPQGRLHDNPGDDALDKSARSGHARIIDHSAQIVRALENTYGELSYHEVFRRWLDVAEICLDGVGDRVRRIRDGERDPATLFEDSPAIAERWRDATKDLKPRTIEAFSKAFGLLLAATDGMNSDDGSQTTALSYADVLGSAYMQMSSPSGQKWNGQYFTPWPVASMMAQMLMPPGSIEAMFEERVAAAIKGTVWETMFGFDVKRTPMAIEKIALPSLLREGKIEPVRIMEPTVGSGIMLLACAAAIPRKFIDMGFIEMIGIDVDPICCRMAAINMRLYGLGHCATIWNTNALTIPWINDHVPWPDNKLMAGHKEATVKGDKKKQKFYEEGIELRRQSRLEEWDGLPLLFEDDAAPPSPKRSKPKRIVTTTQPANPAGEPSRSPLPKTTSLFDLMEEPTDADQAKKKNH